MLEPFVPADDVSSQSSVTARTSAFTRRLIWVIIVFLVVLVPVQIYQAWDGLRTQGMDLQQDYIAGQRLLAGSDMYARFSAAEIRALGVDEARNTGIRINAHPPLTALVFAPLTLIPYEPFTLLWSVGCVALLLLTVWAIIVELHLPLRGRWLVLGLLLLLH